jgi:hypothetical protein
LARSRKENSFLGEFRRRFWQMEIGEEYSMRRTRLFNVILLCGLLCLAKMSTAQTETATVSGRVSDKSGAIVPGAKVEIQSVEQGIVTATVTDGAGIYVFPSVHPGQYRIAVQKEGFRRVDVLDLVVNVQDHIEQNFSLQVGSISESITVSGGAPLVNTEDASVSTVVDRNFAENLPMNGRSFQTLIDLTPGVVVVPSGDLDSGQFSVNGQRASSNYWMVDGVSANVGSSTYYGGNGVAGAAGTSSTLGGTNSLVSVDALQEFRIQTSTFAPEFGRTPGAQISIVTRSGANQFHGSVFDYLRNDIFDASNWFNAYTNNPPLPKAEERQNDLGGSFSGRILKDRTFFFFSYEGLRLRLPTTALTQVPDLTARQNASPALQPYLNAFPQPNGPGAVDSQGNLIAGAAQFNKSYSNPATLDAYSLRIDHHLSEKVTLFGRYNYSPSKILERGVAAVGDALSSVSSSRIGTQTVTIGSTWTVSARTVNELRFNYSRTNASGRSFQDSFGGAEPLLLSLPSPYTAQNGRLSFDIFSLAQGSLESGLRVRNVQRQVNLVDNISVQVGAHHLKFGVDYRRLSPVFAPFLYQQIAFFGDVPSAGKGQLLAADTQSLLGATLLFRNLGAFVQDTWLVIPRLTVTYGLRWDTDFSPSSIAGPSLPAVTGFDLHDLSHLALAPAGTPAFKTAYRNVTPRVGLAYQLSQSQNWGTVARGGFGVFDDLASSEAANIILQGGYPFSSGFSFHLGGSFPPDPISAAPPPIEPPNAGNRGRLAAFDPNLQLPYTLQWNVALEQGLGGQQSLSATYIGSLGRRLIQTTQVSSPNRNIAGANLVANTSTSGYNALQLQFQRRLLKGLQVLASYSWSHSIDTASAGSAAIGSNTSTSGTNQDANRGSSDFDIRNAFSGAVTFVVPAIKLSPIVSAITRGWSLESIIQARSSLPVEILNGNFGRFTNGFSSDVRPDVIAGIPLYLYGRQYPGGKAINNIPGAVAGGCSDGSQSVGPFCSPPADANGSPLRQGSLGRNTLRGFGATQWDFAVHRDFPIHESLSLQFRAEMFNVLNHPSFAPPVGDVSLPQFGLSTQMLGQFLGGGNLGSGSFSPLYQIGGPRSMQFALKLSF